MNARRMLAGGFLLIAGIAAYLTWLCWRAGDDGKWLFGVFAVFFLLLALAPSLPKAKPAGSPPPATSTRFVPHWFMLLAGLIFVVTVLAAILGALLRR